MRVRGHAGGGGGVLGLLSVRPHFCWGGVGAAKGLLPCFLVPKGNQPTACTLALWWLKFGPTETKGGGRVHSLVRGPLRGGTLSGRYRPTNPLDPSPLLSTPSPNLHYTASHSQGNNQKSVPSMLPNNVHAHVVDDGEWALQKASVVPDDGDLDIQHRWDGMKDRLPTMYPYAIRTLCIPDTPCDVERPFSTRKNVGSVKQHNIQHASNKAHVSFGSSGIAVAP